MKSLRTFCATAALVFAMVGTAQAGFVYRFEFDALTNYAAAAFEFETPTLLLSVGDSAAVSPPGDLNGYLVGNVTVNQRNASAISFAPDGGFFGDTTGTAAGDIIFFFFLVNNYTGGTGVFTTADAGRDISGGVGAVSSYNYTSGRLTISEAANPVPEPPSLALVALALCGLGVVHMRHRRICERPLERV